MTTPARPLPPHRLLYGADYNPDQWLQSPEILAEDLRLMRLAGVNTVSLGIFSWVTLEPEEGRFEFAWLDQLMDRLHANGVWVNLATPSGAKPAWMAHKYPEIRRVTPDGRRERQQGRHNHCPTSPVYREKVHTINSKLAERYANHPALQLWHISNEYGGYCYYDLCFAAFRDWLRHRYNDDLDALNQAWWSRFWSHTFTDWDLIDTIDGNVHGMQLDWQRFMTDQVTDFLRAEIAPLRVHTPNIPVTTNFMGTYDAYDYWKLAEPLDLVSWDSYPDWHGPKADSEIGCNLSFIHDIYRAMKPGKPWLLMETTPSVINWNAISRPRRPGVNRLNSLHAIAHGSDSVLYFQWRKGRGGGEKFHGAIVDHVGHENTRVVRDCAEVAAELAKLGDIAGARTPAQVAVIYDWQNEWAIRYAQGPRNRSKDYQATCVEHYRPFWRRSVSVDVIDSTVDLSPYRLLIAPMLYMLRPGVAEKIAAFVEQGGTFVATYLTGTADENDLCFLGGFPGPLRPVLGVWAEEVDVLHDHQSQRILPTEIGAEIGLSDTYEARHFCEIIHPEGVAEVLATYDGDFYAGTPALTRNAYGAGTAYYIASRNEARFADDLLGDLITKLEIPRATPHVMPDGVTVQSRRQDGKEYLFVLNFTDAEQTIAQKSIAGCKDTITGIAITEGLTLPPYGATVLERPSE